MKRASDKVESVGEVLSANIKYLTLDESDKK